MLTNQRLFRVLVHEATRLLRNYAVPLYSHLIRAFYVSQGVNHRGRLPISNLNEVVVLHRTSHQFRGSLSRIFRTTRPNVMTNDNMGVKRPPILRTHVLALMLLLIPPSMFHQFRRLPHRLKVLLLPRVNRRNRTVRIRKVSMTFPKRLQIRYVMVHGLSSLRYTTRPLRVPTTFHVNTTKRPRPNVTRATSRVLPNVPIRLFVP